MLFPNNVTGYRKENKNLTLITNHNKKINIKYNKINEFDHIESGWYDVYDFFNWRTGGIHNTEEVKDIDDNFVSTLKFYPSERNCVSSQTKDLVCISHLNENQIDDVDYSPIYSRLKALRMIKDHGINGSVVGYTSKGKAKYRKPVIEFEKRVKVPRYVPEISFNDAFKLKQKKGYTWKLLEKMIQHTST